MRHVTYKKCRQRQTALQFSNAKGWPPKGKPTSSHGHWRIKHMPSLPAAVLVFLLLASCASTSGSRVSPPPSLTSPCATPVRLPERGLTDQEIEIQWGRDRTALRLCGSQLDGLAKWAIVQTDKG